MDSNYEHWLTVWKCNNCEQIPESAPLHRCKLGHTYCNGCYQSLKLSGNEVEKYHCEKYVCNICGSEEFEKFNPSPSFLKKLKVKPGIGRPYRYINQPLELQQTLRRRQSQAEICRDTNDVTVEQLFHLPTEKLQKLFEGSFRGHIKNPIPKQTRPSFVQSRCRPQKSTMEMKVPEKSNKIWLTQQHSKSLDRSVSSSVSLQSKKPLMCPHDPCRKVVAISSFNSHFKHEHPTIERYSVERGRELVIPCDASVIEHNTTFCLAMISVYEITSKFTASNSRCSPSVINVCNKFTQKMPVNTFWLMVSGSPEERHSTAYALYWLFTNNDEYYNCTFEMSSSCNTTCCSTFCGVNGIHDSQKIVEVAQRLNCLYLSRGSLISLLEDGPSIKLGITIH